MLLSSALFNSYSRRYVRLLIETLVVRSLTCWAVGREELNLMLNGNAGIMTYFRRLTLLGEIMGNGNSLELVMDWT